MKKHSVKLFALLFVLALFMAACSLRAQTVGNPASASVSRTTTAPNAKIDQSGNYVALKKVQAQPTKTGKTFTDSKGNVYPVWMSPKGKLFYTKVSKAGNEYSVYITL